MPRSPFPAAGQVGAQWVNIPFSNATSQARYVLDYRLYLDRMMIWDL